MSEAKATSPAQDAAAGPQPDPNWPRDLSARLRRLGKATMQVTVELGRTRIPIEAVLNAEPGSVIELERMSGQPVDILVNGVLFGKGEIVVLGDNMAVRITDLLKPEEMSART